MSDLMNCSVQATRHFIIVVVLATLSLSVASAKVTISSRSGIRITVDKNTRSFVINNVRLFWTYGGTVEGRISNVHAVKGGDRIGRFQEIVFTATDRIPYRCSIRAYENRSVVLFKKEAMDSLAGPPGAFPVLSKFPRRLSLMTFSEREFGAPPIFREFDTQSNAANRLHSGPLVFFDSHFNACIISPALNFMVASVEEDSASILCGVNANLVHIPKGFTESTILVMDHGINRAWDVWGRALTDLYQKKRPSSDADVSLKYLSYWTDNGAAYYYHYDTTKGYDGTLLTLKKQFDKEHVPIRSMQLDSWWYAKGYDNPDGSIENAEKRITNLPAGTWNRFGGMLQYEPPKDLFSGGLKQFHDSLRLPLIVHNRWISRDSPYRTKYKVSGIGVIDRHWWASIMGSIASWGISTYEQDWLDRIYEYSPEFSSTTWAAEDFMDDMASAARAKGLTIQYCMALPRHYLQGGAKYSNVTSIRVSGDRFNRNKWKEFLYGSRFASALGIWPWCDVFMSRETPNILLASLSAGVVGIGDTVGTEDTVNIAKSARLDGVIVKPDVPLTPIDESYADDVHGKGVRIATTYSDHARLRTLYLFAYADSSNTRGTLIPASAIGVKKAMFVYDYFAGSGRIIQPGDSLRLAFNNASWCYEILAPVEDNGIAFIGDTGKFVPCGRQRIGELADSKSALRATILLAKGEESVTVCGYAPKMPMFLVYGGYLLTTSFDVDSHIFTLEIHPQDNLVYHEVRGDMVGKIMVEFRPTWKNR